MLSIEKTNDTKQTIICSDGRRITLLGTAHVSKDSVDEVAATIEEIQPDRVCVELDIGRYNSKTQNKGWEELNLKSVLKENKGFLMLANMALSSYQKRLGEQLGVQPGDEIMGAVKIANEKDIPVSFCDREIQVTFKRAWRLSNFWNKMKLISVLISSIFSNEKINNEDIEKIKETDILQSMLEEMAKELPTIKRVLIDERDQFLASSIYQAEGKNIVAVVGAGHVPGLVAYMQQLDSQQVSPDTQHITYVPEPSPTGKIFSWGIIIALLAIIGFGFARSGWEDGLMMFLYWFALNASLTGIAALLSLAHPATIVISMLAAPVTALNPTIGVGMVAGIIEATVRKPRVKDFEHLTDDIQNFKGWFKNRIIHTLMIFMTTSIFASIGTFVAFPVLISKLHIS